MPSFMRIHLILERLLFPRNGYVKLESIMLLRDRSGSPYGEMIGLLSVEAQPRDLISYGQTSAVAGRIHGYVFSCDPFAPRTPVPTNGCIGCEHDMPCRTAWTKGCQLKCQWIPCYRPAVLDSASLFTLALFPRSGASADRLGSTCKLACGRATTGNRSTAWRATFWC